jgi:flagellar biosynthetic protein FliR
MIAFTSVELNAYVGSLLWPFMRIGAMLMAAPVFGARLVPVRVRLALAVMLAWILSPMVYHDVVVIDPLSAEGLMVAAQQVLIGLAMGFTLQLVFSAVVIAAQSMAMGMGLGFATAVDPQNGVQVPVVAHYYLTLATLIFLAMNGHLLLIQVLVDSFQSLPVGVDGLSREGIWALVNWGGRMFAGAVLIALTAMTSLLIINIAFGVMSRAAPQLNIFGVGFPVMMGAGFIVIMLGLPGLTPQLADLLQDAFELIGLLVAGS